MRAVWKFPLTPTESFGPLMQAPAGAKPLFVGIDPLGAPCLWMEVETTQPRVTFNHVVLATGQKIPEGANTWIGSFVLPKEGLVFHVYTR